MSVSKGGCIIEQFWSGFDLAVFIGKPCTHVISYMGIYNLNSHSELGDDNKHCLRPKKVCLSSK